MSLNIISRDEWGAKAPTGKMYTQAIAGRTGVMFHYLGGELASAAEQAQLRSVQAFHQGSQRRWADLGYNLVIGQSGTIYEGRGRDFVAAHCPGFNRSHVGILFMLGGDQSPSPAARAAAVALVAQLEKEAGKDLPVKGHRDGKATECPGDLVYGWLKSGMPVEASAPAPASKPEPAKPAPKPAAKPVKKPLVKRGSRGAAVQEVQRKLGLKADGIFGPNTEAAVKEFQRRHKAAGAADGIVGDKTWAVLAAH